jgi:hypothetical protein
LLNFFKRMLQPNELALGVYTDSQWLELFKRALERDGSPNCGRRVRLWMTMQLLESTRDLDGQTAEAGVLFGLSSFLICSYRQLREPGYRGAGHHAIDSFRGFEHAHAADLQPGANRLIRKLDESGPSEGNFRDRTARVLAPFPDVKFHEGWIPGVFDSLDESAHYRFVHIDVDLHDPTLASLEYFVPRVVPSGILVIDDYGFPDWPGCKTATDAFCEKHGVHVIPLPFGNAAIIKRGPGP